MKLLGHDAAKPHKFFMFNSFFYSPPSFVRLNRCARFCTRGTTCESQHTSSRADRLAQVSLREEVRAAFSLCVWRHCGREANSGSSDASLRAMSFCFEGLPRRKKMWEQFLDLAVVSGRVSSFVIVNGLGFAYLSSTEKARDGTRARHVLLITVHSLRTQMPTDQSIRMA